MPTRNAAKVLAAQARYYLQQLAPATTKALLDAAARADVKEAARQLEAGNASAAADAILSRESIVLLQEALTMAGVRVMVATMRRVLANEVAPALRVSATFLAPSRYTIAALESLRTTRVIPLVEGSRQAVTQLLTIGQLDGLHPSRLVAQWAKEAIGLTPYDVSLVESFERQLIEDPARALTRTLRDPKYDGTLARMANGAGPSALSAETRGKMVAAYENELRTWRASTYSTSTTLDALRQGQASAWADAAEANGVDLEELVKTWITTLDGRERPAHHDMHGTTIPFAEPFMVEVNGALVPEQTPGENEYNCRCAQSVRLLPSGKASRASFARSRAAIAAEASA